MIKLNFKKAKIKIKKIQNLLKQLKKIELKLNNLGYEIKINKLKE